MLCLLSFRSSHCAGCQSLGSHVCHPGKHVKSRRQRALSCTPPALCTTLGVVRLATGGGEEGGAPSRLPAHTQAPRLLPSTGGWGGRQKAQALDSRCRLHPPPPPGVWGRLRGRAGGGSGGGSTQAAPSAGTWQPRRARNVNGPPGWEDPPTERSATRHAGGGETEWVGTGRDQPQTLRIRHSGGISSPLRRTRPSA